MFFKKKILLDANVLIYLCEFEYRCKGWNISEYFQLILKLISTGELIVLPEVHDEVIKESIRKKPMNLESWERYDKLVPSSLSKVLKSSWDSFKSKLPKNIKNTCKELIDMTITEVDKVKNTGIKTERIAISTEVIEQLRSNYTIPSKLDIGKFLLRLASTVKIKEGMENSVDMILSVYAILGGYHISTYDKRIVSAFKDVGKKDIVVYQHYFLNHFNISQAESEKLDYIL